MTVPQRIKDYAASAQVMNAARQVEFETGVTISQIFSKDRHAAISQARQLVYLLAWQRGASKSAIARVMQRDHSSVSHGITAMLEEGGSVRHKLKLLARRDELIAELAKIEEILADGSAT